MNSFFSKLSEEMAMRDYQEGNPARIHFASREADERRRWNQRKSPEKKPPSPLKKSFSDLPPPLLYIPPSASSSIADQARWVAMALKSDTLPASARLYFENLLRQLPPEISEPIVESYMPIIRPQPLKMVHSWSVFTPASTMPVGAPYEPTPIQPPTPKETIFGKTKTICETEGWNPLNGKVLYVPTNRSPKRKVDEE